MASWCSYERFYFSPYSTLVPLACPETGLKEVVQGTEEAENGFFFPLELFLCQFSFLNWIRGTQRNMSAGTGKRNKHARKRQVRDYTFQRLLPSNWLAIVTLSSRIALSTHKRLDCAMADLLKNTIEKKETKMLIISTSCSSISQWAFFSYLIIPATISVVLLHCGSTRRNQLSCTF